MPAEMRSENSDARNNTRMAAMMKKRLKNKASGSSIYEPLKAVPNTLQIPSPVKLMIKSTDNAAMAP